MNNKRYKLVIFDMDGTILDTLQDLHNAVNHTLAHFGYAERGQREVRTLLGNGSRFLLEGCLPKGIAAERIDEILPYYSAYYKEHCAVYTRPYDGIKDLISLLRGKNILTAVVSNKPDFGVQKLNAEYFDGLFDFYCGEREGIRRKPAPDSVNEVMRRLNVKACEAVYIGDSEVDIQTAANAGMDCITVSWGFRDKPQLVEAGAKIIVEDVDELQRILTE